MLAHLVAKPFRFASKFRIRVSKETTDSNAKRLPDSEALAQDLHVAKIAGEETSDLATTLGAMEQFTLSRTGITVGYPKAQIIRLSGDLRNRNTLVDSFCATRAPFSSPKSVQKDLANMAARLDCYWLRLGSYVFLRAGRECDQLFDGKDQCRLCAACKR